MTRDRDTTLPELRREAEGHGTLQEPLSSILQIVGVSDFRTDHEQAGRALAAAGLSSTPPIAPDLPLDTLLTLTATKPSVEAPATSTLPAVLRRIDTDNPYLQRLFAHELFGVVPERTGELFRRIETVTPTEQLISAMRVDHGVRESGILMITTQWLRYLKRGKLFTAIPNDEFWPLDGTLELVGSSMLRTADGRQFQVRSWNPIDRRARAFHGIYNLAALAIHHAQGEQEEAALEGMAHGGNTGGSTSVAARSVGDLRELVALRNAGDLTADEFAAAKARLLGL